MAGAILLALLAFSLQVDLPLELGAFTVYHNELLLLAAAVAALLLLKPQGRLRSAAPWALAFAPLALWLLAHATTLGAWESMKAVLRALQFVLPLALAPLLLRDARSLGLALRAAFLAGILGCSLALAQSFSGGGSALTAGHEVEVVNGFQEAFAGMSHHNQWGVFLAAWLVLACACALRGRERGWALAALAFGLPALACSFSRGAWLSTLLGLAFLFWLLPHGLKFLIAGLGALAALFVALGPSLAFRVRLASLLQDSDRSFFRRALLEQTHGLPVWGLGEKGLHALLVVLAPSLPLNDGARAAFQSHTHNFYLQQALAWGWPSLLGWALALLPLVWAARRALSATGPARLWGLALAGSLTGFLLQSATDLTVLHARGVAVSLCWGLLLAALALDTPVAVPASFGLQGRRFFLGTLDEAGALMLAWARRKPRSGASVHVANVHTLMDGRRDADLGASQDEADLLLPDGRPLSLAAKALGDTGAGQVRGPDILRCLAREGRAQGASHYFYGGVPGAPQAVAAALKAKSPGLKVAGAESPPFRPPSDAELRALVRRLKAKKVDFLWLGLGAPRQEKVMARLRRLGCPCVMLGVGAAFDYEAGAKTEAPAWMQGLGLEWLFRLASEPGRLWRRYLSTNPRFVGRVLLEAMGLGPWPMGVVERGCRLAGLAALGSAAMAPDAALALGLLLGSGLAFTEAAARRAVGAG